MSEIGIKELKNTASRVIDDAEDFVLAHAEEFVRMRLSGQREHDKGKSIPINEL